MIYHHKLEVVKSYKKNAKVLIKDLVKCYHNRCIIIFYLRSEDNG